MIVLGILFVCFVLILIFVVVYFTIRCVCKRSESSFDAKYCYCSFQFKYRFV